MSRLSVRGVMLFVVAAAIGLAALRNANVYWAAAISTLVLLVLATSTVGAMATRNKDRSAWAGFAVFCGLYLAFNAWSQVADPFKDSFGPTLVLNYLSQVEDPRKTRSEALQLLQREGELRNLQSKVGYSDSETLIHNEINKNLRAIGQRFAELNQQPTKSPWIIWLPGASNVNEFLSIGHGLFALLFGLLGTVTGRIFYTRRIRCEAPTH